MNSIVIKSTPEKVVEAIETILAHLKKCKMPMESFFDIKLILSELFVNALNHGNRQDPEKKIFVNYVIEHDKIVFTIQDEGDGFDYLNIHDPALDENILKPSGRGLFLVKSLADFLEFKEKGNVITVGKSLL